MDYFKEYLLTEDLIDDLGFRSDKSKWANLGRNLWGTFQALTRYKDLFEFTDEGKYEDFLVKGFQDVIKQRGSNVVKVTYRKALYTITEVNDPKLNLLGISNSVKGKTVSLSLSKVKVAKAQEGTTGYETSGSYEYLRNLVNQPAVYIFNKKSVNCTITQITASRVVLKNEEGLIANLSLENHLVYPNENKIPTITDANITFSIIDMVSKKGKEGEDTPDYTVDKTLFNINYNITNKSPFRSVNSDQTYQMINQILKGKNNNVSLLFVKLESDEDTDDISSLPVIKRIANVKIKTASKDKASFEVTLKDERKKDISIDYTSILDIEEASNNINNLYLPLNLFGALASKLGINNINSEEEEKPNTEENPESNTEENTDKGFEDIDLLDPKFKKTIFTTLIRYKKNNTDVTLDIGNKKSKVKVKKITGDKITLINEQGQELYFDVDRIERIENNTIFVLSPDETDEAVNDKSKKD